MRCTIVDETLSFCDYAIDRSSLKQLPVVYDVISKMSRNMAAVEKEILIKNAMIGTKASYNPPPMGKAVTSSTFQQSSLYAHHSLDNVDINEVYPNIFISDEGTAKNKTYLVSIGITHVVNAAEGHLMGFVNTSSQFYQSSGISYKGIHLADLAASDASKYFKEVADYMDKALQAGGKVLVHCVMGISRSGIMVLAYLMLKQNMTAIEAMTAVRHKRNIHPNDGFIHQLAKLDNKLIRKRRSLSHPVE